MPFVAAGSIMMVRVDVAVLRHVSVDVVDGVSVAAADVVTEANDAAAA